MEAHTVTPPQEMGGRETAAGSRASGRSAALGRWILAGVGLALLVGLVYPLATARRGGGATRGQPAGGHATAAPGSVPRANGCDAKASPANLDFVLTDMHGQRVSLAAFKGKALVINFWATWCPPCKGEIPALVELQKKYADAGLVVLGVSTDDPPEALREFAKAYEINYPVLLATPEFLDTYGPIWAIPVSVFVGRDATICRTHMGPATLAEFERQVKALL